ncbi:MAG: (2Fe-2S) ferredoxin domain-containing protein [Magnetococcales bacterium]|nr:(2Fe-2S) ferredoxin domain-containing protein [Magnetococcales bacterium]
MSPTSSSEPSSQTLELSLIVCVRERYGLNPSCAGRGSRQLAELLRQQIGDLGLPVQVKEFHCLGSCNEGPNMRISPGGRFWRHVTNEDVAPIISELKDMTEQLQQHKP